MRTVSEETLAQCLELLSEGLPIEQILARYPDQTEALRPFLETAGQLTKLATQPSLAAKERSSQEMLRRAAEMANARETRAPIGAVLRRLVAPAASFAAILFLIGAMLFFMSASTLPGDGLYGAKQLVERVRLAPLTDPEARAALQESFNQERIREVEALLRSGRDAEVRFEGRIGELETDHWTIAAIRVEINDETVVEGTPQPGAVAQLHGRTHDGKLIAIHIVVAAGEPAAVDDQPKPKPEPTATSTPVPTETSTPEAPPAAATPTISTLPDDAPAEPPPPLEPTATPDDGGGDDDANDDDANQNGDDDNDNDSDDNDNDSDDNDNDGDDNDNDGDDNDNDGDDNDNDGDDNDNDGDDNDNDDEEDDDNLNDDESDEEDDESDHENDNEHKDNDNATP